MNFREVLKRYTSSGHRVIALCQRATPLAPNEKPSEISRYLYLHARH